MTFSFFVLYNMIRVPLYVLLKIAGFFNVKIRRTFAGRQGLFEKLESELEKIPTANPRIWMHIASMGEFEQGVPLIDEIAQRFPNMWIIVSLFSPSVYEHLVFQKQQTVFTYLPFDSCRNVRRFLDKVKPSIQIIIRHDIWPNYQWGLQRRFIPSILVDASFSDKRLKSIRRLHFLYKQVYATFSAICVISDLQKQRLALVYPQSERILTCGDTRYDRVYSRAIDTKKIEFLSKAGYFLREKCFVAGSTWPADEKIILPTLIKALKLSQDVTVIIAPHEVTADHLEQIEETFSKADIPICRLSIFKNNSEEKCRVLLIDSIGLLANLYALGAMAYVGGAFGIGVHSVLEPAAHGAVVCYGPFHLNSPEAKEMTAEQVAFSISTEIEFEQLFFEMLNNPNITRQRGQKTKEYVLLNVGASQRTADVLEKFLNRL